MHSNIFQLSAKPISAGDFLTSEYFYDDCHFADYIGDEFNDEERHKKIKWLSVEFPEMFDFVNDEEYGEGLIFKGMGNFLAEWVKAIKDFADTLTEENILKDINLYNLKSLTERTNHRLNSRFFIENWNNCVGDCADFIEWLNTLEVGTRIYFGSVIDYHF